MKLLCLVGPTASGKSKLAFELAKKHDAIILSCDSLLVYQGLDIATAKPSTQERSIVQHYGIDLVGPEQTFTAGDYVRYARPIIDQAAVSKKKLILVGGSGFYLKALLFGVWDVPPTQPQIRAQFETNTSTPLLYETLKQQDPQYAEKIKPSDRYRLIRALEIMGVTGKPLTEILSKQNLLNPLPYPYVLVGINPNKKTLEQQIINRTNQMFAQGIVQETKKLLSKFPTPPRSFYCVGTKEVMNFLAGKISIQECKERIIISTRQLAKKQNTFFRSFPAPIQWFASLNPLEMELARLLNLC